MRSVYVNDAPISDTRGHFTLSNIALVRLAIMIRIHEVSRSTLGPFPRRHHVDMAYPDDKGFQALKRQVAKTAHYFPRVCSPFPLSIRACQCGSYRTDSRKISNWKLSLKPGEKKFKFLSKSDTKYRARCMKS